MITVSIFINSKPIFTSTAVTRKEYSDGTCGYEVDDGSWIVHNPEEGAGVLAKKMVHTIKDLEDL
jgi:hypothetical protein